MTYIIFNETALHNQNCPIKVDKNKRTELGAVVGASMGQSTWSPPGSRAAVQTSFIPAVLRRLEAQVDAQWEDVPRRGCAYGG